MDTNVREEKMIHGKTRGEKERVEIIQLNFNFKTLKRIWKKPKGFWKRPNKNSNIKNKITNIEFSTHGLWVTKEQMREAETWGQGDGSVVGSTCYSFRWPQFGSKHLPTGKLTVLCNSSSRSSSVFWLPQELYLHCTLKYIQVKHSCTQKGLKSFYKEYEK